MARREGVEYGRTLYEPELVFEGLLAVVVAAAVAKKRKRKMRE